MLVIVISFAVILGLQYLFCRKIKNKKFHFIPIGLFFALTCVFTALALTITGWDAFTFMVFAMVAGYATAVCGIGLLGMWIFKKIDGKED